MKKKSIGLIVRLMGFALLGVMSMQLYFLRQSYQMQSELFDRSVNDALGNVVSKLARQDANNFLNRKAELIVEQRRQYDPTLRLASNSAAKRVLFFFFFCFFC